MQFTWDVNKAATNWTKHKVSFEKASTVFADVFSLLIADPSHSEEENRLILIGLSQRNRLLVVVNAENGETMRLISARPSTAHERKQYEQGN